MSTRAHIRFSDLCDAAEARGLRVELRDDGITHDAKPGRAHRRIAAVKLIDKTGKAILARAIRGLDELDAASEHLLVALARTP